MKFSALKRVEKRPVVGRARRAQRAPRRVTDPHDSIGIMTIAAAARMHPVLVIAERFLSL